MSSSDPGEPGVGPRVETSRSSPAEWEQTRRCASDPRAADDVAGLTLRGGAAGPWKASPDCALSAVRRRNNDAVQSPFLDVNRRAAPTSTRLG